MRKKIFILIFCIISLVACDNKFLNSDIISTFTTNDGDTTLVVEDPNLNGMYITKYEIYWSYGISETKEIYSDKEIYTCSFQGTNFLLEKDNTEEIFSTTAPIRILSCKRMIQKPTN